MIEGIVGFLVIYGFCAILRDVRKVYFWYMEDRF